MATIRKLCWADSTFLVNPALLAGQMRLWGSRLLALCALRLYAAQDCELGAHHGFQNGYRRAAKRGQIDTF